MRRFTDQSLSRIYAIGSSTRKVNERRFGFSKNLISILFGKAKAIGNGPISENIVSLDNFLSGMTFLKV